MLIIGSGILWGKEDKLVKDLKETSLSFKKLGKKYGVSRQAIYHFCKRRGIERPKRPKGYQTRECSLCQKLIQISKKPQGEFISIHTMVKETGESRVKCLYHLRSSELRDGIAQRDESRSQRGCNLYVPSCLSDV